jgi:hypothetical protein
MVFATRKEIRKYYPRYRSLSGEGILDFNTDCTSGQLEPGDLGKTPPPKRGRLCETCCFFAGIPEEQVPETTPTQEHPAIPSVQLTLAPAAFDLPRYATT